MSVSNGEFTPTQARIMAVLGDGRPHTKAELLACLDDDLAPPHALGFHISNLRKKLAPKGQGIRSERTGFSGDGTLYCLVTLLANPYDGVT
jgi:hypothetical protein